MITVIHKLLRVLMVVLMVLMTSAPATSMAASNDSPGGVITKKHYKEYYRTWTVVEVTDDEIVLERTKNNGEVDTARLERSRRPYLKVGDKVRYDKVRNRLRKTIK